MLDADLLCEVAWVIFKSLNGNKPIYSIKLYFFVLKGHLVVCQVSDAYNYF